MDFGTGDGRAVLARAAADPCALVIGVDAAASAMTEASRRATRRGPANALFLAAGAEGLGASVLAGRVDLVTVTFPWGSLLRGMIGLDGSALAGVASVLGACGRLDALVSVVPADGVPGLERLDASCQPAIRAAWLSAGLRLAPMRPASVQEVAASGSTWARRLGAGGDTRPVWRLEGCRVSAAPTPARALG
jgi:16S rRNA (adenine(1408)-N(1))-methyltransferase